MTTKVISIEKSSFSTPFTIIYVLRVIGMYCICVAEILRMMCYCVSPPISAVIDVMLVGWNRPQWEPLLHGKFPHHKFGLDTLFCWWTSSLKKVMENMSIMPIKSVLHLQWLHCDWQKRLKINSSSIQKLLSDPTKKLLALLLTNDWSYMCPCCFTFILTC